ncbi:MAG: hypothetical protein WDN76_01475 [Alphaproteobacteria bacterium]
MTHYTFTCRDRDIVLVTPIIGGLIIGGFRNDAEAIAAARALAQRHEQVEVWQGASSSPAPERAKSRLTLKRAVNARASYAASCWGLLSDITNNTA